MKCLPTLPVRRALLAGCIAGLLATSMPTAYATTFVTNCNDSGTGSLRAALASAPEGDTIDATGLASVCSKITLKTGDIQIAQNSLAIDGPGRNSLTVTAKYNNGAGTIHQYNNRIFTHTGNGLLEVSNMTLNWGYATGSSGASGGCIQSSGSLQLYRVDLRYCTVHASSGFAGGGAVYAIGKVAVKYSNLASNTAYGTLDASGGAIQNLGAVNVKYSTITGNHVGGRPGAALGEGGAVYSNNIGGSSVVIGSTISANSSSLNVGGLIVLGGPGSSFAIKNSTISGNTAVRGGGVYTRTPSVGIYNSTIAFNTASTGAPNAAAGITLVAIGSDKVAVNLVSNVVSNNSYGASHTASDLGSQGTVTISGNSNLVFASSASLPADTVVGKCPLLKPLTNNGGLVPTHGLFSHSPAIDHGANPLSLKEDQRGRPSDTTPYPFAREIGPPGGPAVADMGAFEVNQAEEIFDSSFEGC